MTDEFSPRGRLFWLSASLCLSFSFDVSILSFCLYLLHWNFCYSILSAWASSSSKSQRFVYSAISYQSSYYLILLLVVYFFEPPTCCLLVSEKRLNNFRLLFWNSVSGIFVFNFFFLSFNGVNPQNSVSKPQRLLLLILQKIRFSRHLFSCVIVIFNSDQSTAVVKNSTRKTLRPH